jgi:hypothetical protein
MESTHNNLEFLKQLLQEIKEKGKSHCVTITSMGNLLYILNDGFNFYVLLVPNKKLSPNLSQKILQIEGWAEKFALTNYHKTYDIDFCNLVINEVNKIFIEVLRVPQNRIWRFETNPGMMVVKAHEISLDAKTRRERNKIKANSILRHSLKLLWFPFSNNLRFSISSSFIIATIILIDKHVKREEVDTLSLFLILGVGPLLYAVLQLRYPDRK